MFSILLFALLIGAVVFFFPIILAFFAVILCLIMAAIVWIKEAIFSDKPDDGSKM